MSITKIQSESLNLADTYAFTGTVTGAGENNTPLFRAYIGGSDQTIATGSWTKVAFNTETFDPSGVYDHSSNYRFTPAVAGYYLINAHVRTATTSDWNNYQIRIYKNGTAFATVQNSHYHAESIAISTMDLSDADDYYEVYVYQDSGSNKDIRNIDIDNFFQAFKVST